MSRARSAGCRGRYRFDEIDQAGRAAACRGRARRVILRQDGFERRVVALDRRHRVIDDLADRRLRRGAFQIRPARFRRHPENIDRAVLVRVFRVGAFAALRVELGVFRLERVGNVFEKNQPEHDMLVLGRIHIVAQRVGRSPQLGLEAERCAVTVGVVCAVRFYVVRRAIAAPCQPVARGGYITLNLRLLYSAAIAGRSPKCCRQRSTHSFVSFSWAPFCDRRRRRVRKSTRSMS